MIGTALLIKKDQTVTVLENIHRSTYEYMAKHKDKTVFSIMWREDSIDWDYGY